MHRGFIKLHRKIKDHWLYEEKRKFSKFEAWIDLLMRANHKDTKVVLGNELIELKRGQFITSELKLMEAWGWGKSKTRDFLKLLENDGMIVKKSDRKKTTITICNYSVYHDYENENRPQSDHEKRELENSRCIENGKIRPQTDHDKASYDNDYSESSRKIRPQTDYEQTMNRLSSDTEKNDKNVKNDKDMSRFKLKFETHHLKLAELLFREIKRNNPKAKKPNLENWANTFRLMMERDGREGKEIQDLILFSQRHEFWHKNILSADKLRKQFDRLTLEMNSKQNDDRFIKEVNF